MYPLIAKYSIHDSLPVPCQHCIRQISLRKLTCKVCFNSELIDKMTEESDKINMIDIGVIALYVSYHKASRLTDLFNEIKYFARFG